MPPRLEKTSSGVVAWGAIPSTVPSIFRDLPILFAALALFYAVLSMTHYWLSPAGAPTEIHLEPSALPKYAMFSVLRIAAAWFHQPGVHQWFTATSPHTTREPRNSWCHCWILCSPSRY